MDPATQFLVTSHQLITRAENSTSSSTDPNENRPPVYKAIGISLAIASGVFIGVSFVLKKTGLLRANEKYNEEAGEGYGYLKNAFWWTGMTLMILGEICNFVAYAFVDAILVTPLGALSVVITTILSAIFLKERLSFVGKIGCFNCIIGSVVIVMNAPEQAAVRDIQAMQRFVLSPGFLSYAGVIIVGSAFIALWVGPRYGKKNMLVYLSVCSLIGGLSVVATQGLGSAVLAQARGESQFNKWFLYVLLVFVITTLLTEIVYLNKALNLFNAALVTPTYYVFFTSATIVTSAILFQGFKGTAVTITTVILGFLQICAGVVLLQLSKSAKDVPDAAVFKGDLDQVREVAEQEQPETEPKADALRGTAAIIRRISMSRQKMEQEEAKRLFEEKRQDQMAPIGENEVVEWDGIRRRKTILNNNPATFPQPQRRKTLHPPLGMSHFPTDSEVDLHQDNERDTVHFFKNLGQRAHNALSPGLRKTPSTSNNETPHGVHSPMHPVALTEIAVPKGSRDGDTPTQPYGPGSLEEAQEHIYGLPASLIKEKNTTNPSHTRHLSPPKSSGSTTRPTQTSRRQFSFQNVFHRAKSPNSDSVPRASTSQRSRSGTTSSSQKKAAKKATEEERLGLVKGDSHVALPLTVTRSDSSSTTSASSIDSRTSPSYYYDKDTDTSYHAPPAAASSYYPSRARAHDTTAYEEIDDSDEEWQIASKPSSQQTSPQRRRPSPEDSPQQHHRHPLPRPPPPSDSPLYHHPHEQPPHPSQQQQRHHHQEAARVPKYTQQDPYRPSPPPLPPAPPASSRSPPLLSTAPALPNPPLTAFRMESPERPERLGSGGGGGEGGGGRIRFVEGSGSNDSSPTRREDGRRRGGGGGVGGGGGGGGGGGAFI